MGIYFSTAKNILLRSTREKTSQPPRMRERERDIDVKKYVFGCCIVWVVCCRTVVWFWRIFWDIFCGEMDLLGLRWPVRRGLNQPAGRMGPAGSGSRILPTATASSGAQLPMPPGLQQPRAPGRLGDGKAVMPRAWASAWKLAPILRPWTPPALLTTRAR